LLINKAIIVIILSVLLYVIIAVFSDFTQFTVNLQNMNLSLLPLILCLIIASITIRSLRQHYLLKKLQINISRKESWKLYVSGLSMLITPGSSGELIKSHFLQKNYDKSISKTIPLVFIERFQDFLAIVFILSISLIIIWSIEALIVTIISAVILSSISILILQKKILFWLQHKLERITFFQKYFSNDNEFYSSLFQLFQSKIMIISFLFSVSSIFLDGLAAYLGIISIIPEFNFIEGIQKFFTSILAGFFSFLPAGIGVTEITFLSMLQKDGIDTAQSASSVLYVRLTTLWFMTLIGFLFLKTMYKKNS